MRLHCIRNARAADGKLDGNYYISIITAGVARNALDGKADGNLYGKTHDFHYVTIVFASPTVNVQLCLLHYLLGRHVYIPGACVQYL